MKTACSEAVGYMSMQTQNYHNYYSLPLDVYLKTPDQIFFKPLNLIINRAFPDKQK